jgi:hypothetical protein
MSENIKESTDNVNSSRLYWPELLYFFEYTTAGSAAKKWRSLWVRQSGVRLPVWTPRLICLEEDERIFNSYVSAI